MFEKIIGNDSIKEQLVKSLNNNQISHSYLFIGIEGIGKKLIATEFAKAMLCLNDKKYCNNCKSCIEFDSDNNPDFLYIEPDGNSIKIDQIREMQKKLQEKPIISKNKVYIINNADKMTTEAQNSLLKTLEEPPEFVTIILIGSNENMFLTTIKSRCMILHFNKIDDNQMKKYLKENQGLNEVTQNMLELFQGSIGKAIELKDKQNEYLELEKMIEKLSNTNLIDVVKSADILYQTKDEIYEMLDYVNIVLLRLATKDVRYTNCIQIVENTKKRLMQNANYDMCIDNMLFNIWEEVV